MGSLTDLARFRDPNADPEPKSIATDPRFPGDDIRYLAFDQTLTNCGMVDMALADGRPVVNYAQTLRPPVSRATGYSLALDRSVVMQDLVMAAINYARSGGDVDVIVFETPPKPGPRIRNSESALLGAHCVCYVAHKYSIPVFSLSAQRAKTAIGGFAKADKKAAHEALKRRYGKIEGYHHVGNEHERDALMLGLTYLIERQR